MRPEPAVYHTVRCYLNSRCPDKLTPHLNVGPESCGTAKRNIFRFCQNRQVRVTKLELMWTCWCFYGTNHSDCDPPGCDTVFFPLVYIIAADVWNVKGKGQRCPELISGPLCRITLPSATCVHPFVDGGFLFSNTLIRWEGSSDKKNYKLRPGDWVYLQLTYFAPSDKQRSTWFCSLASAAKRRQCN